MGDGWQASWDSFVETLAEQLRAGVKPDELSDRFGGKSITWTGTLYEKQLDDLAPSVSIDLPEKQMDLGEGCSTTLNGFSLQVADHAIADWERRGVGIR